MKKTRTLAIGAFTAVAALSLAACSSGGSGGSDDTKSPAAVAQKTIGTVDGSGKTLKVWVMTGDYSPEVLKLINDKFTQETGAKVKVEEQQWADIATKLTTALSDANTTPDVADIGNTQVAGFAAAGGLMDISAYKNELQQGGTWVKSLLEPSTFNGSLYAVPSFVGNRAVIYNKKIWADAGVTAAPTTYDELKSDLDKIKAKNTAPDFSAFYLPGQFWYAAMSWVWDQGGNIATQDGDTWKGALSSAEAQKGLEEWKSFQNTYSTKASQTVNSGGTGNPEQTQIMADGKAATIIGAIWDAGSVVKAAGGKITEDDLGTFPIPGKDGVAPNFGGGEVWGIGNKSANQDLALAWTKIAAGPEVQTELAKSWIPNTEELAATAKANATPLTQGFYEAAGNTRSTPGAKGWVTIEGNKDMENFFKSIASGSKSVADAAKDLDSTLDSTLNG